MMKLSHEKKKTLPYKLIGLRTGIDLALWLYGLISGAIQRYEIFIMAALCL